MIYLIIMSVVIIALIVYGFVKQDSQVYKMGILLLAVFAACAGGYFFFT